MDEIQKVLAKLTETLDQDGRVRAYNEISKTLGELVADVSTDPALSPRLVPTSQIRGNDYNPNHVATPEMDLLEESIRSDGVTMPIVVMHDGDGYVVVDGFHRHRVVSERLERSHVPCSVIDRPPADRMASTVRHNRARGKHQVDLMAAIVGDMSSLGWGEDRIAEAMGMSPEELLRLRQMEGAAKVLASREYSRSWGVVEDE